MIMSTPKPRRLVWVGLLQALGLTAYCSAVAIIFWQGNNWFGLMPEYFGFFLFLLLFSTSALVCGLITGFYPFILWQRKQTIDAFQLVLYTAAWLLITILLILIGLSRLR